jgi:hypothetical protein
MLASMTAASLIAADLPYSGKWKLNPTKSDFGDTTVTYEQVAGGEMKATMDGQSYTFKADGKEYSTPWGMMFAWKSVDPNTWEMTEKANGKVTATNTIKLSSDGKTMTIDTKRMKASGESSNDTMALQRVSGGPGLAGKWKTKNVKISAPGTMDVTASGSDGLKLSFADENGTCDAKFDGKDYPAKGTMWPAGWTCEIAKDGTNGFDVTWKKDGKPMYKSTFTASSDGKTLTQSGGAVGSTEKIKAVYDRQAGTL